MADIARLPIPPHSIEAEQSVLGALLIDGTVWARVATNISPADFFRPDHRLIYSAIAQLASENRGIDIVTVSALLERQGTLADAGGLAYLGTLARDTPSAGNVETYATVVRERASLRQLRALGEVIQRRIAEGEADADALAADLMDQLQHLQSRTRRGKGLVGAQELISDLIDDLDRRSNGPSGLSLGLLDLDALTNGLEAGDLVVIAARPGMGKTALLVSITSTVSSSTPAAVFSAEMPAMQLMRRALALQARLSQGLLRRADKLTQEQWQAIGAATAKLAQRRLWVDDAGAPTLQHIRSECIALNARQRLGLVLIDYVQLVRGSGGNRYEQLRDVAYGCKDLAKELALPVIVLAQLNRGVESRDQKRPQLSDLRDSGAIEEAADIVGLLYSEGYYNPDFGMPSVLECQVAKSAASACGTSRAPIRV